jgi:hypothetical protein
MEFLSGETMLVSLIKTYLVNFIYVITKSIAFVVSCFLCWRIFDVMEKIDFRVQIAENKNIGVAIMVAALFLGLGYVIGQV